jgi:hypothetical protein
MKIYFFSKKTAEQTDVQKKIIKFLKESGVLVFSNLLERTRETDNLSFTNMNGLIVEGDDVVSEAGYFVALALAQEKQILYLLPKGFVLPDQLRFLLEDKKLKKFFHLAHYSPKSITDHLADFIDLTETGELRREVPTIKFTLRFTPRADRYLNWTCQRKNLAKADYLRKLIEEQIISDVDYQKFSKPESAQKDKE